MAQAPAICPNCGLVFPSGIGVSRGISVLNSKASCRRCGRFADVLDGYGIIIKGMVTFVLSPKYSRADKLTVIDIASAVGRGEISAIEASNKLGSEIPEGKNFIIACAALGLTFLSTIATVASFVLDYSDRGGNEPLEAIAMEKFDETLKSLEQPILPEKIEANRLTHKKSKQSQAPSAKPHTPNENRKTRRARRAVENKKRSKSTK